MTKAKLPVPCIALCLLLCGFVPATSFTGLVTFAGAPVPGALVTATQGDKKLSVMSGPNGVYTFDDLPAGDWNLQLDMEGFVTQKKTVTVSFTVNRQDFDLEAVPIDSYTESTAPPPPPPAPVLSVRPAAAAAATAKTSTPARPAAAGGAAAPASTNAAAAFGSADLTTSASDALAVNGSVLNGASSAYGQSMAFGNNRPGGRRLYTGTFTVQESNSALNALPFSSTGQKAAKPDTNLLTTSLLIGGPLLIPHLDTLSNAPNFNVQYSTTRNDNESIQDGILPTVAERTGDLSSIATPIIDPQTGQQFPGNVIPSNRISPQAQALLSLYPLPNASVGIYNYQLALLSVTHTDAVNSTIRKSVTRRDSLVWQSYIQNSRAASPTLFGFLNETSSLGLNETLIWNHRYTTRQSGTVTYNFSRQRMDSIPFFSNRENVSGNAGIEGNNQAPLYWGPPSLSFSSGITGLSQGSSAANNRNQTGVLTYTGFWNHGGHNFTYGGDFRRLEFNTLSQSSADGAFGFSSPDAVTHDDFADFLLGIPDSATLSFGNADKYFRQSQFDLWVNDDFRAFSNLTVNAGFRWEYSAPVTELYGRLVNLDAVPGFTAVAPVLGSDPVGSLTGTHYPSSLVVPDKHGFRPSIGIGWRPLPASSLLIRAGFGMAFNTSVYQSLASLMASQSPLAKSLSIENSAATPLTLANGFNATPASTPDTFALDPNFRIGYVDNWNASLQEDLPAALQMVVTYAGIKGTRAMQEFAPNTYAPGAANPCPACPAGFVYVTSNGNSTYESGKVQLVRRFRSGFSANTTYTYAHAIDDASSLGGGAASAANIAQNWLDLDGQRGPSSFDQRHNLAFNMQYSTGIGGHGGALLSGWRGHIYKGWTVTSAINAGSGMPLTPIYPGVLPGTTYQALRPDYTGAAVYSAPAGMFLNPAAFSAPAAGQFGTAGRDSLRGPNVFTLNAAMQRSFQLRDRMNLSFNLTATNPLNQILITGYNVNYGSALFGAPVSYSSPRNVATYLRLNF